MNRSIQGILWDMDGVLMDTGELHYQTWSQILPEYGEPIFSYASFLDIMGRKNEEFIPLLFSRPLTAEQVAEIGDHKERLFRQSIQGRAHLLPGAREWLERFSSWGMRQAIASSAPQENVDALASETGIRSYFSALVSVNGLPGKPDPAVFLCAAKWIGVEPERCLVIEDAVAGVEAARRGKMRCLAVTTSNPEEALRKADLVLPGLDQLSVDQFLKVFGG